MLYVVTGSDTAARAKYRDTLIGKHPVMVVGASDDPLSHVYQHIIAGSLLFHDTSHIVIKQCSEVNDLISFLEKNYDAIVASSQICILDDFEFTKAQENFFSRKKITIQRFDNDATPEVNIFSLTDALGTASKREIWRAYHALLEENISAEDMTGPLWWWLKNLGQTYRGIRTAKPFVQKKIDAAARAYGSSVPDMIVGYGVALHRARGGSPLELELEQWMMKIAER